jgi:formate dehydrogenase
LQVCDVVTINCPLHPETEGLFNKEMISKMKRGAYIVNTARGKICDRCVVEKSEPGSDARRVPSFLCQLLCPQQPIVRSSHCGFYVCAIVPHFISRGVTHRRQAIVDALKSGQLAGYAGDVWFPQPAPKDHPWRTMPHHGMTPHMSGTSLSAQARYVAGAHYAPPHSVVRAFFCILGTPMSTSWSNVTLAIATR